MTNPKLLPVLATAVLLTGFVGTSSVSADGWEEIDRSMTITVVNETGHVITALYVSPHDKDDWGDDLLGEKADLANGESTDVTYEESDDDYSANNWDLKAETGEGETEFENLPLGGQRHTVTLLADGTVQHVTTQ
jgi:hypothetical protein